MLFYAHTLTLMYMYITMAKREKIALQIKLNWANECERGRAREGECENNNIYMYICVQCGWNKREKTERYSNAVCF